MKSTSDRRLMLGFVGALSLLCLFVPLALVPRVVAQTADAVSRTVTAERFVLVDKAGKPLATLGLNESPGVTGASLIIGDKTGRNRVVLGMVGDRSVLQFLDAEQNTRMTAGTDGKTALVTFFDPVTQKVRMMVGSGADGTPQVSLHDSSERGRLSLHLTSDEHAVLKIADEREVTRASFGFSAVESPSTGTNERSPFALVVSDRDGKVLLKLP